MSRKPKAPQIIFLRKYLHCTLVSLLVLCFVLWSRNVHRQQPERSEIFIFSGLSLSGLSLARFKITADILTAFAGEFFTEEIKTQSRYNVVQIEVNFVSTRRDSDKPKNINIWLLPLNIVLP